MKNPNDILYKKINIIKLIKLYIVIFTNHKIMVKSKKDKDKKAAKKV
jgi:hypothetical protein